MIITSPFIFCSFLMQTTKSVTYLPKIGNSSVVLRKFLTELIPWSIKSFCPSFPISKIVCTFWSIPSLVTTIFLDIECFSYSQHKMMDNANIGYKLACFGRLWWRLGRFSENQTDLPNIGLVFEFGNWSEIRSNRNAWGSLNSQINWTNYIARKR